MTKKIAIFGSTGSIGTQTLDVIDNQPGEFQITALAAGRNIDLLEKQIRQYRPEAVAVSHGDDAAELKNRIRDLSIRVYIGKEGLQTLAVEAEYDLMVMALVGNIGLEPVLEALQKGVDVAIATKEVLVAAGALVMALADQSGSRLIPVDSEHSAIFQCLQGQRRDELEAIILTASGGPFRAHPLSDLASVTVNEALKHPNWRMGQKITVDSATLINKGLEVLEAKWLFSVELDQIQVVVHPQSIIHSMIRFQDGSVLAQMGLPDMRGPIQYALNYPWRKKNRLERLRLSDIGCLTFEEPDLVRFPGLRLAYDAGKAGGTMPAVFNAANEVAVDRFIRGGLSFLDIPALIEDVMSLHSNTNNPLLETILEADRWARETALKRSEGNKGR